MPASAQRPCAIKDLTEWFFGPDPSDNVPARLVHGKLFAGITVANRHCKAYLGKNVKMVEYIKRRRNEKVRELMRAEGDPSDVQGDGSLRLPKRDLFCKRDLFDMIPPIVTLDVETA